MSDGNQQDCRQRGALCYRVVVKDDKGMVYYRVYVTVLLHLRSGLFIELLVLSTNGSKTGWSHGLRWINYLAPWEDTVYSMSSAVLASEYSRAF